jgi:DNA repair photolyase
MNDIWAKMKDSTLRLDAKEMKTNLGKDNFIFIGSSTDMFAVDVLDEWLFEIFEYLGQYGNRYLFQSKNTDRLMEYSDAFPLNTVIGTTIETNRDLAKVSKAPSPQVRAIDMAVMKHSFTTMVTIEPIMDFDLEEMVYMVMKSLKNSSWVNIGADSKGNHLPEPSAEKVLKLIEELNKFRFTVNVKANLERILNKL